MKSLKYLAIICAVAGVALTAVPANAGSVGVKGGKITQNKNVVEQRDEKYTKDNVKEDTKTTWAQDKYEGSGGSSYKVTVTAVDGMHGDTYSVGTYTFADCPTQSDWIDMRKDAVQKGRWGYNIGDDEMRVGSSGKIEAIMLGEWGNAELSYSASSFTPSGSGDGTPKFLRTDVVGTSEKTDYINTTEKFTGSDTQFVSREYSFNDGTGILIGDVDNLANAYAATDVSYTDNYLKTNHYLLTKNYVHTVTTEKQNVYQNQSVVYTANLTVNVTPIVLDLDGDGKIEASNGQYLPHKGDFSKNTVLFDFYGNGFPVAMEWVGTNDGLLCRPEADGTVKGGNLFGSANGYQNGYDEMISLDKNNDGQLTGEELNGLMVWQDENHNGVADKGELKSLESLGITSIGTANKNLSGIYTRNGKTYKTFDWHPSVKQLRKVDYAH
jgi:hypothetical protein